MSRSLITKAQVITPGGLLKDGWLACTDGKINAIGKAEETPPPAERVISAEGAYLLPGFIDLHVHGAMGHDVMDADLQGLREQARFFAAHGVTSFLPTTLTGTRAEISAALATIQAAMQENGEGAQILGAHLEGPYLNAEKAGAQNPQDIRRAERGEALEWLATGIVRLVALAPEFSENDWLIKTCVERGIRVSAAHTNATYLQMQYAVSLGLSQTTHTFNGMRGLHHREPGVVGAALDLDDLTCELIADNIHVHPASMHILLRAKGIERVILITDSTRGTGMPDGEYQIGGQSFTMRDRESRLSDGTLAGSTATMDGVVANFAEIGGGLSAIWQATSLNAARQIGVDGRKGSLEIGKDADLVIMSENYTVLHTLRGGELIYSSGAS